MLKEIKIQNLVIIDSMHLEFNFNGFSDLIVMTGETGAGKSIILKAIHLVMGGRASLDWIREGAQSCIVEAIFAVNSNYTELLEPLRDFGVDSDCDIVIKRVLMKKGRSKYYINGSMASAKMVSEITVKLMNIAGQHDQQKLLQAGSHIDIVDTFGELWEIRRDYSATYKLWQHDKAQYEQLIKTQEEAEQRREFLDFQITEIRKAELFDGEDEQLDIERKRLKDAELLIQLSHESYQMLSGELLDGLVQIRKNLGQIASSDASAEKLSEDWNDYSYLAEDFTDKIRSYRDLLDKDPLRLEQINERIDQLNHLKRKYNNNLAGIMDYVFEMEKEVKLLKEKQSNLVELEESVSALEKKVSSKAELLSTKRKKTGDILEQAMSRELGSLMFNQSVFKIRWVKKADIASFGSTGCDNIEFFFSANPGEEPKELSKIASGGELSRLMLAVKCLLAKKDKVETVVFDEVDTGIGGEAAEAVARKIQELSSHHQVFCITHLSQIAARGTCHYLVKKEVVDNRTQSRFVKLSKKERVEEISRMLAGESVSGRTEAWAKEMLLNG